MDSPSAKKSLRPKIRAPFSPKSSVSKSSPTRVGKSSNPGVLLYSPQTRIFNSRSKMSAEMLQLQERIASAEKARDALAQANTRLHLEYRTLSEELNTETARMHKLHEKRAEKTKYFKLESVRMKARIAELETELEESAKARWRSRMDSRQF